MAVHGYITHAAHNRRCTAWLILGYIAAFELIGAFALMLPLLNFDHEHTILSNPLGYAVRYAIPIAALAGFMFWRMYRGHARAVTYALGVRLVSRQDEPRFVAIAEEQCTALGVRLPRFGIIEADEPNAVTVGEGPARGLIAVTRGLLDQLDDDELAAVLAHEASHIRQGDTKLLAANHALMRTAVILQTHNPLRFENWRQMIIPVLIPPMLLILLAGSAATMFSMRLARAARRGLKLSRDYTADGEAIRVTHFPEALASAIAKIGGRGAFYGSARVEGMLFDGQADHEGGSHPAINDRIDAINTLGRELMNPARPRRDSRVPARPVFGRRPRVAATNYPLDASGRPLQEPRPPKGGGLWLFLTDRETFWQWQNACIAWQEWRPSDRRNAIGLTPKLIIPLGAACVVLLFMYWPTNGNFSGLMSRFNPADMVELARMTHSGPFCVGPSYPDKRCPGQPADKPSRANTPGVHGSFILDPKEANRPPPSIFNFLLLVFVIFAIARPGFLRKIFGVAEQRTADPVSADPVHVDAWQKADTVGVDALQKYDRRIQQRLAELEPGRMEPRRKAPAPSSPPVSFGRRKTVS
jgi:Zn-dependent protease with chaperone function